MFAYLKKNTKNTTCAWGAGEAVDHSPEKTCSGHSGADREFFRIDAGIVLQYWTLGGGEGRPAGGWMAVNISGGGIRFPATETLYRGEQLQLRLVLPRGDGFREIFCCGQVVRFGAGEDGRGQAAVRFVKLSHRDQDKIVAFCFAEQRKQLRRRVRTAGLSS